MWKEFPDEFKEMYERIIDGEKPLDVLEEYTPKFNEKGIGRLGIANYLVDYVNNREY